MIGEFSYLCKLEIITSVIELNPAHGVTGKPWWNSNTCKNILNHAIDENNIDSISVDVSKISTNGQSIPFLLILTDWGTGRCEMTYGCYRGNDKLQIPYILDTGNKNVICDGENLTVTFTMSSYCKIIYWNHW